jgi:hypothetical protein
MSVHPWEGKRKKTRKKKEKSERESMERVNEERKKNVLLPR